MSILLASIATSNTSVRPSSRRTVVFSVISGRRMTSVSFMMLVLAAGFGLTGYAGDWSLEL